MVKEVKKFSNEKRVVMNLNAAPQYIQDINCRWIHQAPFFSTFLSRFKYEESDKIPTIGVRAKKGVITLVIGIDKDDPTTGWFQRLSEEHQEAVLVHEILHLVFETHFTSRGKCLNPQVFNIAADICINDQIEKSFIARRPFKLPEEGCRLKMVTDEGYEGYVITEPIYYYMMDNKDKFNIQEIQMMGMGGEGSGSDSDSDGKSGDKDGDGKKILKPFDSHDGLTEQGGMDEISKATVQGMTHVAKMKGYGQVGGNMNDFVKNITTSKINWRSILRKFMKSTQTGSMYKKHNWGKANRRSLPLPGKKKFDSEIVVAIDTSGSISNSELEMFFSEIDKMAQFTKIRLVCCDTDLYDMGTYKKGDWKKIEVKGRGGTELSPIFKFMIENEDLKKTRVVILTDGEFNYDFDTFGIRALWALTYDQNGIKAAFAPKNHDFLVLEND